MFTISKEFSFEAAHSLKGLPETHPCSRRHGHSYKAVFTLRDKSLNEIGFVTDYRELEPIKNFIDDKLDHRNLNDVLTVNPTAENIAKFLFDKFKRDFPQLISVTLKETDKTSAVYQPD